MDSEYPVFLDKYPKTPQLCDMLQKILTANSNADLKRRLGINQPQLDQYLDIESLPDTIPKEFIQAIFEFTQCDISELNQLARAKSSSIPPKQESSTPQQHSSGKSYVTFDRKTANALKVAMTDVHNYDFFTDVMNMLSLPLGVSKQLKHIFHNIVVLCMSSPSYQLLQYENHASRNARYIESIPEESDNSALFTKEKSKKASLKTELNRKKLLEMAQRAHYYEAQYLVAQKFYIQIIQKHIGTPEYYEACIGLLALYNSDLTKRNLNLERLGSEQAISQLLQAPSVWEKICKIFDDTLQSPNGNPKRVKSSSSRSKNVGGGYSQNRYYKQQQKRAQNSSPKQDT